MPPVGWGNRQQSACIGSHLLSLPHAGNGRFKAVNPVPSSTGSGRLCIGTTGNGDDSFEMIVPFAGCPPVVRNRRALGAGVPRSACSLQIHRVQSLYFNSTVCCHAVDAAVKSGKSPPTVWFALVPHLAARRVDPKVGYRADCGCPRSASTRRFDASNTLAARKMGTAKFEPEKSDRTAKFTPITFPLASNTGPPDPP